LARPQVQQSAVDSAIDGERAFMPKEDILSSDNMVISERSLKQ